MKKFLVSLLSVFMLMTTFTIFTSCGKEDDGPDPKNGDRYELTDCSGIIGWSIDAYDYNYIDFNFENNTYSLKNRAKQNQIVSRQTGTFVEDESGYISVTNNENPAMDYLVYYTEDSWFSDEYTQFNISARINGELVEMIYTKDES